PGRVAQVECAVERQAAGDLQGFTVGHLDCTLLGERGGIDGERAAHRLPGRAAAVRLDLPLIDDAGAAKRPSAARDGNVWTDRQRPTQVRNGVVAVRTEQDGPRAADGLVAYEVHVAVDGPGWVAQTHGAAERQATDDVDEGP